MNVYTKCNNLTFGLGCVQASTGYLIEKQAILNFAPNISNEVIAFRLTESQQNTIKLKLFTNPDLFNVFCLS